jgi:hypothetical protein
MNFGKPDGPDGPDAFSDDLDSAAILGLKFQADSLLSISKQCK